MAKNMLLGTGLFDAIPLYNDPEESLAPGLAKGVEHILELTDFATLPFYLGRYEPIEGKPDFDRTYKAAKALVDRGVRVKGHPLVWHTVRADWLDGYPTDVVLGKLKERIQRDVTAYKGVIDTWDVINEVVIMPVFREPNAISKLCSKLGRVQMIKEMFSAARECNPDACLLLNDFNTSQSYEILIDGCLNAGVEISAIGIQSHQHQGFWGVQKLFEVLDRFAVFKLPIHFTENTLISGELMPAHIVDLNDWQVPEWKTTPEGETRQADETLEMYQILRRHPLVEAFTIWDASDNAWLGAPAGLLRKDYSRKQVYFDLQKVRSMRTL